jgi:3-keto-disaccharide hydrolase
MTVKRRVLLAAFMALGCSAFFGATWAHACGNGKVIYEDKFATLDPSWGTPSDRLSVDNGALVIKPEPGTGRWAISQSDFYGDAAICADVTVVNVPDPNSGFTAIVFWYQDNTNYYEFGYWPGGDIRVNRVSKGRTLYPVPQTDTPALKKGAGQTNSLEVQTVGNRATLFVNGTNIAEFNGKAPEGGGLVGLESYSPKAGGETEARFTNFVVAEPK